MGFPDEYASGAIFPFASLADECQQCVAEGPGSSCSYRHRLPPEPDADTWQRRGSGNLMGWPRHASQAVLLPSYYFSDFQDWLEEAINEEFTLIAHPASRFGRVFE
jgi:hypothetical protein